MGAWQRKYHKMKATKALTRVVPKIDDTGNDVN